jgi:uncharacterized membrane protein (UPF0127 family)
MQRPRHFFYIFCALAIFFVSIAGVVTFSSLSNVSEKSHTTSTLDFSNTGSLDNVPLKLAFARTKAQQTLGLSFQNELKEGYGLLFIYKEPGSQGIWMKDMNFPIDVFWFDENYTVVTMKENFLPASYPEIFYPTKDSLYILEAPSGFAERHQIKIGSKLKIYPEAE